MFTLDIDPPSTLLLPAHGSPEPGSSAQFKAIRDRAMEFQGGTRVVPLFLARGGYVNRDLPAMAEVAQKSRGIEVDIAPVPGDTAGLREAIAQWAQGDVT